MKRMMMVLLCICILSGGLCHTAPAETAAPEILTAGDYEYVLLPDGTAEILKYYGHERELVIPSVLNGAKVTSLGDESFVISSPISVSIPDGVTSIGNSAFWLSLGLTTIHLPDSLLSIGNYAFESCPLTSVFIPDSVISIGLNPFLGCDRLTEIVVSPDHPLLEINDGVLFSKKDKRLIWYPLSRTDSEYAIPQGTTSIGESAFTYCKSLSSVIIPDSITSIEYNPFQRCDNLTDVVVSPDHPALEIIDGVLFSKKDKRLIWYPPSKDDSEYVIPQGTVSIGGGAFYECGNLTSVVIPDGIASIGNEAFYGCENLDVIIIPDSVEQIGDKAFGHCHSLTAINLSKNLSSIGDDAFTSCLSLSEVAIPEGVVSIGNSSFYSCASLTSITIPDSVISIGTNPFQGCRSLTEISVSPDHPVLETINGVLFDKTDRRLIWYPIPRSSKEYAIPQGTRSIGDAAFYWCENLTAVIFPDSLIKIGDHAFDFCTNLTSVKIPESVSSIEDCAFARCGLPAVIIPNGVTTIGSAAFGFCYDLTDISISATVTSIRKDAFKESRYVTLTVPRDSYAAQYCKDNNLTYTYPDSPN